MIDEIFSKEEQHAVSSAGTTKTEAQQRASGFKEQALKNLKEAYDQFCQQIGLLNVSKEGEEIWTNAKKQYDFQTAKIETELTKLLKLKLERAANANEMFGVFTVYNKLFARPKIRGAITQY